MNPTYSSNDTIFSGKHALAIALGSAIGITSALIGNPFADEKTTEKSRENTIQVEEISTMYFRTAKPLGGFAVKYDLKNYSLTLKESINTGNGDCSVIVKDINKDGIYDSLKYASCNEEQVDILSRLISLEKINAVSSELDEMVIERVKENVDLEMRNWFENRYNGDKK